jgi:23S rRNA (guanine745-N1)-methyltransferase
LCWWSGIVSSLLPRPGHGLLRCPLCRVELTAAAGALVCRNHHGFDLAREGYVNLLRSRRRRSAAAGDSAVQLRHRADFLDAGHFDAIATTIAEQVQGVDANTAFAQWRILDAGFGTGHQLAKLAAALPAPVIGLGLDIAKDAARQAARRWPALAFAVADLWTEWPVHNAAVDLVMGIFAPKNFPEAARVLRPGGWLAIAYPGPDHLVELRERFGLMDRHKDAPRRYAEMARHFIGPSTFARLRGHVVLDGAAIRNAVLMGPNGRHINPSVVGLSPRPLAVTINITLLFARTPERNPWSPIA